MLNKIYCGGGSVFDEGSKFSRRDFIKKATIAGATVAGASMFPWSPLTAAAAEDSQSNPSRQSKSSQFNEIGNEIINKIWLKTSPVALKLVERKSDVPDGANRIPEGQKWALCQ